MEQQLQGSIVLKINSQIRRKDYPEKVAQYSGDMLLVGINYNKTTKRHDCRIE